MSSTSIRSKTLPKTHMLLVGALLSFSAVTAMAADTLKTPADIQATYEHDRAKCLSGQSNEDQATCLKEAGAAREEAKRGKLTEDGTAFHKNEKERCDVLSGDEKRDCISRTKGGGIVSGSVGGGGVLRETVTPLDKILLQIAAELKVRPAQVNAAVTLLDGGATVPFIARYRKEVTDNLDDIQLRELESRWATCASWKTAAPRCSRASRSRAS
jgi:hypothetical protein